MANASGVATRGFLPADFFHRESEVHYRVFEEDGTVKLTFERDSAARPIKGERILSYYLGSGRRGRTYLFEEQGYWFELPINWYSKRHVWDMTPAYQGTRKMPLTLAVDPGCLHCHTSDTASNLPQARNRYAGAPFNDAGISCEACHGNADSHLLSAGRVPMLKIRSLDPVRRDSICLNCHLEGQIGVTREGRQPENFRPGDDLFDFSIYFVRRREDGAGGRATSQWEALLKSECKQRSGDRLTCTTCHDPHGNPPPDRRIAFYRQKCLQCHSQHGFAERHHPENPDCTGCHMGRGATTDIAHEQLTDHWIQRHPAKEPATRGVGGKLVAIGSESVTDRDLGIAYAQEAAFGDRGAERLAFELLRKAEKESSGARDDNELHARLGFLEQVEGKSDEAASEYRQALAANRYDETAAADLAFIEAQQHQYSSAVRLWKQVLDNDPAASAAGLNLAIVECSAGDPAQAREALERVLAFDPDNDEARNMRASLVDGNLACRAH
jgi:hypothetical protein